MFCHKCGTEIADGAGFCHKCGTKVVHIGEQTEAAQPIAAVSVQPQPVPVQKNCTPSPQPVAEDSEFRTFIDSRVRASTPYQSAQELLDSKVSQKYVWLCFGIPALLFGLLAWWSSPGVMESLVVTVVGTFLIGYPAARIGDLVHTSKYSPGFSGSAVIDCADLTLFLNTHMRYLEPHFHEWQEMDAPSAAGALGNAVVAGAIGGRGAGARSWNASQQNASAGVYALFGKNPRWTVKLSLKPDNDNEGQTAYNFVILCHSGLWAARAVCAAKATPIVKAAMEYYLSHK